MRTHALAMAFTAVSSAACLHAGPVQTTFDRPYPERNGAGDPILAVFVGRLPCAAAGCDMRKVELVLYRDAARSAPTTYWLGQVSVGRGDDRQVQTGTWAERRSAPGCPQALVYVLDEAADPSLRRLWRVDDDILLVLGPDLRPRAGNGAWGNMLSRDPAPYGPRTYRYDERARRFVGSVPGDPGAASR